MAITSLETDYLVIGGGAMGMAFTDTILSETDADLVIVDQNAKPGGHWNHAYPFVTLHQPSSFYGVSSKELSRGQRDQVGLNKGLGDLASGNEVLAYYEQVMNHTFLPSGRVRFFPMCRWRGDGRFEHILTGEVFKVSVRRKTVDATHLKTSVPSTHTPGFDVTADAWFLPPNDLPKISRTPKGFVVIGAGKTAIDSCLWLLEQGVAPDLIQWIMPRDAWLLDRRNTQTEPEFFFDTIGAQARQFDAIAQSASIEDMFDRLEAAGYFLRLDPHVRPEMFHGATVSRMELEALRQIRGVIRKGRVKTIRADTIVLDEGEIAITPDHVLIDCSARAVSNDAIVPVFQGEKIVLQMVRSYQPVFSAAFIAHIEAAYEDEAEQNRLCGVVPLPNHDTDFIRFTTAFMMNQYNWSQIPELRAWLRTNRLDGFSKLVSDVDPEDTEKTAILQGMRQSAPAAVAKLFEYLNQLDEQTATPA
ncbi:NAD(P)/FAD-dependent oxidoreductase [Oceanicaulis alexandrii]|uniref:NAD(P)/FAD-dependent oxidoreductase n=1 Tax=Oceanicaulis alexandrii TaxID=153233 RepID=UPI0035CF05EF